MFLNFRLFHFPVTSISISYFPTFFHGSCIDLHHLCSQKCALCITNHGTTLSKISMTNLQCRISSLLRSLEYSAIKTFQSLYFFKCLYISEGLLMILPIEDLFQVLYKTPCSTLSNLASKHRYSDSKIKSVLNVYGIKSVPQFYTRQTAQG